MILLYSFLNKEKQEYLINKYLAVYNNTFRETILYKRKWQDRQQSLLGRILLDYGLKTFYSIQNFEIEFSPTGKPFLKNQNVHFNISHSRNIVVCIIARFPLGIDIEFLNPQINYLDFESQMTCNELSQIQHSQDNVKSLFTYWTRKESLIKAHGGGLLVPLKSFEIINDKCEIDNVKFYLKDVFINENYRCCIASSDESFIKRVPFMKELDLSTL